MKTYITKLKHILPVYFLVVFGTVLGLALIRWVLCLQSSLVDVNEEVWTIWIPIVFPWIPILLFLRQRLRILTFKKDNDKGRTLFQFITWLTMTAMLMLSQSYLTTDTGKLKVLLDIKEISKVENVRYYKIQKFSVAPYYGGSYADFRTSGKYNQELNFNVYFSTPILSDTSERITSLPKFWYGIKFGEQISNKISSEEKENKYQAFFHACLEKMKKYDFYSLDHFERIPTSEDRKNFLKAVEGRTKQTSNDFIILKPIKETYESRNGNKFSWIFGAFGIGFTVFLFSLIWPGYSESEHTRFLQRKKPKQDDLVDMFKFLVPKDEHFATSILLDLNILVFLLMVFSGVNVFSANGLELLQWGANRRMETTNGEWWRLFTSMFLHGGIMHLILNIAGLVIAATFLEPLFGRKKFFILYLLSGLCGSVASIIWYTSTISVGASGAIFGVYGAILGLLLTNAFPEGSKKTILSLFGVYVVINLLWGLTGGIDNAAHIGGLLSGALIGIILYNVGNEKNQGYT